MKKYLLFEHEYADARGGMFDLTGSYDTVQDAKREVVRQYWHVIDRDTFQCVAGNDVPDMARHTTQKRLICTGL